MDENKIFFIKRRKGGVTAMIPKDNKKLLEQWKQYCAFLKMDRERNTDAK